MINTEKINRDYGFPEGDMTAEQMIGKIVSRTGVTREQAREALEKFGGDLLDAMIYVERTYGQASQAAQTAQPVQDAQPAQTAQPVQDNAQAASQTEVNDKKEAPAAPTAPQFDWRGAWDKVRTVLVNNSLVIYHEGKEIANVPVLFCLIALLISVNSILIIAFGALFFGVSYRFRGPQLGNAKVNFALDTLYGMAQTLKNQIANAASAK